LELVAVRMGYGHLRPAQALAELAGVSVREADQPPLADRRDRMLWLASRIFYEGISRLSLAPLLGRPAAAMLDAVTRIPSHDPACDLARPDAGTRWLGVAIRLDFGRRLAKWLERRQAVLVSTFYAPALAAAAHGHRPVLLVVTDTEVARAWVPENPSSRAIVYCVPAEVTRRRLMLYGVPEECIRVTGFPLPPSLSQEAAAARLFEARCRRFQGAGGPFHLVLAIGGAGAQADLVLEMAHGLLPLVRAGRLRLSLVAGTHRVLARRFAAAAAAWGRQVTLPAGSLTVLAEATEERLFSRFNRLLEDADLLWTKPSELVFFAALGLPLVLAPPVGAQEKANRRWLLHAGAALDQPPPREAAHWFEERLADGSLLARAQAGYRRLPRRGAWNVLTIARSRALEVRPYEP